MKEVEVKAKISNLGAVEDQLQKIGCKLSNPIAQKDKIFFDGKRPFDEFHKGAIFLRIREEDGRILLTLKQSQTNELDCVERETTVSDVQQAEDMIKLLGYIEAVRVNKTRRKCVCEDIEVCLDKVKSLGNFIEAERMTNKSNSPRAQKELFDFLLKLGVRTEDRIVNGYDTLMYRKINGK